jgi:PRTRC genetic system ThiF family protein
VAVIVPPPVDAKPAFCGDCNRVELIGCGGTGAALAELLARAIHGFRLDCSLRIWDGDRVEEANLDRQRFSPEDLGQNKAACLALRLAGQLGIAVTAVEWHFDGSSAPNMADRSNASILGELVITCTDTLASRRRVATYLESFQHIGGGAGIRPARWWLDVGNELSTGQAILGNRHDPAALAWEIAADHWTRLPYAGHVPNVAAVNPAVLAKGRERKANSCATTPFAQQALGVNDMAALAAWTLAAQILVPSRNRKVRTHAIWFDAAAGRMLPRLITRDLYEPWADLKTAAAGNEENRDA